MIVGFFCTKIACRPTEIVSEERQLRTVTMDILCRLPSLGGAKELTGGWMNAKAKVCCVFRTNMHQQFAAQHALNQGCYWTLIERFRLTQVYPIAHHPAIYRHERSRACTSTLHHGGRSVCQSVSTDVACHAATWHGIASHGDCYERTRLCLASGRSLD